MNIKYIRDYLEWQKNNIKPDPERKESDCENQRMLLNQFMQASTYFHSLLKKMYSGNEADQYIVQLEKFTKRPDNDIFFFRDLCSLKEIMEKIAIQVDSAKAIQALDDFTSGQRKAAVIEFLKAMGLAVLALGFLIGLGLVAGHLIFSVIVTTLAIVAFAVSVVAGALGVAFSIIKCESCFKNGLRHHFFGSAFGDVKQVKHGLNSGYSPGL